LVCFVVFQWYVNSSVDITLYSGYNAVDVYRQWIESGHIVNWILPWKANTLSVSPFNHSCIAVAALEYDCNFDINLIITRMLACYFLLSSISDSFSMLHLCYKHDVCLSVCL